LCVGVHATTELERFVDIYIYYIYKHMIIGTEFGCELIHVHIYTIGTVYATQW